LSVTKGRHQVRVKTLTGAHERVHSSVRTALSIVEQHRMQGRAHTEKSASSFEK
jgi:hypothetical protein